MNPSAKKKRSFKISIYCSKLKHYERLENIEIMVMENCPSQDFIVRSAFLPCACIYKCRFI